MCWFFFVLIFILLSKMVHRVLSEFTLINEGYGNTVSWHYQHVFPWHLNAFCSILLIFLQLLTLMASLSFFFPLSLITCSRPTSLLDRAKDSDEDDLHDRDYEVNALTNNLNQVFSYKIYGNEGAEEVHAPVQNIAVSVNYTVSLILYLSELMVLSFWLQARAIDRDDEV